MRRCALFLTFLLLLAACGSDDDADVSTGPDSDSPADTSADDAGDDDDDDAGDDDAAAGGAPGECPATLFEGEITREDGGDTGHVAKSVTGDDIVDAVAWGSYGSYTVYIADHEMDTSAFEEWDSGNFSSDNAIVAADGGLLTTIFLMPMDTGVEAGAVIDYADYPSVPIIDTGGGAQMFGGDGEGAITVLAVDSDRVCFDIEFTSNNQFIDGTVSAPIHTR